MTACGRCGGQLRRLPDIGPEESARDNVRERFNVLEHVEDADHAPVRGVSAAGIELPVRAGAEPVDEVDDDSDELELEKIPEPEVWAQPFDTTTLGRRTGISIVARLAHKEGWGVRATYARGTYLDGKGKAHIVKKRMPETNPESKRKFYYVKLGPRVADSILLRMTRDGQYALGLWLDMEFEVAYIRTPEGTPERVGSDQLRAYLRRKADECE